MIDNPNAVKFANERVRVTARLLAELVNTVRAFDLELDEPLAGVLGVPWDLVTQLEDLTNEDYGTVSPDVYADGSPGDGRRTLTNVELLAWVRVIKFLSRLAAADDGRVERLARKIAFGTTTY